MSDRDRTHLDAIVEQLEKDITDIDVHDSIDLAAAERTQQRDTLYVLPGDISGGDNENDDGGVLQRLAVSVLVLIAVVNRRTRGAGAVYDVGRRERQVRRALVGFTPDGMADPLSYGRGALVGFFDGVAWWQTELNTAEWAGQ